MNEPKNNDNTEVSPVAESHHSSYSSESNLSDCSQTSSDNDSKKYIKLKLLVPSYAAGAIIGKNGETISQIQQKTEARVKLSKPQELYPGTTDRVCLIGGSKKAILEIYDFISQKIQEVPDTKTVDHGTYPRHKQVKILVASSTAGMIIGKGGNIIKEIKKSTNAFIQLSQKPAFAEIPERCVIAAGEPEKTRKVVEIILDKLIEDTSSADYPDIVYDDPFVAPSPFPTGSPYASSHSTGSHLGPGLPNQFATLAAISSTGGPGSHHHPHLHSANHGAPNASTGFGQMLGQNRFYSPNATGMNNPVGGNPRISGAQRFQNSSSLYNNYKYQNRSFLRSNGYPEFVIDEIISALQVLDMHGIKLPNLGLENNHSRNALPRLTANAVPGASTNTTSTNLGPVTGANGQQPNYFLSNTKSTPDEMGPHNRNFDGI